MKQSYYFLIAFILYGFKVFSQPVLPPGLQARFFTSFENSNPFDSVIRTYIPTTAVSLWDTVRSYRFPINSSGKAVRGRINPNSTSILELKPFSTLGHFKVWLDFAHIAKLEFNDTAIIQYSVDGGFTWTRLLGTACRYLGSSWDFKTSNRFTQFSYPADWSPSSQGATPLASWWKQERFDLSPFASNRPDVRIRFFLKDGNNNGLGTVPSAYGWLVDSMLITTAISEVIPPVINHTNLLQINHNSLLQAIVNDSLGCDSTGVDINSVYLYYRKNGSQFDSVRMIRQGSTSNYLCYLDTNNLFSGDNIQYFIKANDSSPRRNIRLLPNQTSVGGNYFESTIVRNENNTIRMIKNSSNITCQNDTAEVSIQNRWIYQVANASLRITYNLDSLIYLGFRNLNSAWNGMVVNGGNGVITIDWNSTTSQNIPPGNMMNLRFRVLGSSTLNWDTLLIPSEFSDVNFNILPQTFYNTSITSNQPVRYNWQRQICQGQTIFLGGQSYSVGGTYQVVLPGSNGVCDTLVNLSLIVFPTQTTISVTTCSNQAYNFNGSSLVLNGVYRDTLINVLGCDSVVTLNLSVNQSYQDNFTVLQCAGSTYLFGNQNLHSTGIYTQTFTTFMGCDSVVHLNLIFNDSIIISARGGINGFCPGGTLRLGTTSSYTAGTFRWKFNGNILSSPNSDSILATQPGIYQLDVILSPSCTLTSNTLTVSILNCNQITGDLRYDNAVLTPLAGVPVLLKTLLGNVIVSDTTDSSGFYRIVGYPNGNYFLDADINYNWGGTNSTDALLVSRFFTLSVSLTSLRARAGDVNGNQITNSVDALLISRRITNLISNFNVGSFVTDRPSFTASGSPVNISLRALSTGDVNGTYNIQPSAPSIVLDTVFGNGNIGTALIRFTISGSGIFERGVCWSSSPAPTINSSKSVADGSGGFNFTHTFTGYVSGNVYVRAYARNSLGIYYSSEKSFIASGLSCPGSPTLTDLDGKTYNTVLIGSQCWMQSNLKVTKYRNGDNIPTGLSNGAWGSTTVGAYAIYDNNLFNDGLYGKLYNHYAVMDARGLCPTGWHVPTDGEWSTLVSYLGGSLVAGGVLKNTAIQPTPGGWTAPNTGATNSSGFTAEPGGLRGAYGAFNELGNYGYWWTSSYNGLDSWYRFLNYVGDVGSTGCVGTVGFSVRCIRDVIPSVSTTTVSNVTATSATTGGNVTQDGGAPVTMRGVAYGTSSSPTISGAITNDGTGTGVFTSTLTGLSPSTTYYVRAYATNSVGTSYGNEVSFSTGTPIPSFSCGTSTVSDVDGNSYNTVHIGTQCWTQSNLKVSKYRNGDNIPTGLSNSAWQNTTAGAYAIYDNNPVNDGLYGKLYNLDAVTDSRGLCPTGWHVPTDGEWTTLEPFLGGSSVAGGALKSTATQPTPGGWNSPNTGATNSSGFAAGPGGLRSHLGVFFNVGYSGYWWASSLSGADAWALSLDYGNGAIGWNIYRRAVGLSVRCLRN
jgi:uncharacterized protein (TIGR02145 family)